MNYTIKSRKLNKSFSFFRPDSEGVSYVFLEIDGKHGVLGKQICYGGGFAGSTIQANEKNFKTMCQNWYRQHMKNAVEYGFYDA